MKVKTRKPTAMATRSPDALAVLLRGGAGKHGDRRTKRQRDRASQRRAAIRDAVSW